METMANDGPENKLGKMTGAFSFMMGSVHFTEIMPV